jgi:FkbM family methyltransferase
MNPLLTLLLRAAGRSKGGSLVSLESGYAVIAALLRGRAVTGILDAGASHGRVSERLMDLFPDAHAYAFEPNPLYRPALEARAARTPRFHPHYLALSDAAGVRELHVTRSPGTTSLFAPNQRLRELYPSETEVQSVLQVETTTIDEWAARHGRADLHVMKLDIQGGELRALRGAQHILGTATLLVYTEVFFNPLYEGGALWSEIDLCLRASGFLLHTIVKPRVDQRGLLLQANAVYIHAGRLGY